MVSLDPEISILLTISFVRGPKRPRTQLNFRKYLQGKIEKPRSPAWFKKIKLVILLFFGDYYFQAELICLFVLTFKIICLTAYDIFFYMNVYMIPCFFTGITEQQAKG